MPSISTNLRTLLWIIATFTGIVSAILGGELAKNVVYWLSRRGRPPTSRPPRVWLVFSLTTITTIIFGALAANAPAASEQANTPLSSSQNIQSSEVRTSIPVVTLVPSKTATPSVIPFTQTPEFSFEKFDHFNGENLGTEYRFLGIDAKPELQGGYLHFDFLGEHHFAGEASVLDRLSLIDLDLQSNALTFVYGSVAVDDATEDSYVFMQVHLEIIDSKAYYANFGLKDTGELFIAKSTEPYELGDIVLIAPGSPKGEFNTLYISFIGDKIRFTANNDDLYTVDSLVDSLVLNLYVTAPEGGHIKTRWDYLGWSFDE